jgi:hypothetical protein
MKLPRKRKARTAGKPKRKSGSKNIQSGRKPVRIKSHWRSPRGPNAGKKRVRVNKYVRKKPKRK